MINQDKFTQKDLEQVNLYQKQVLSIIDNIPRNTRRLVSDAKELVMQSLNETFDIINIFLQKEKGIHLKEKDVFYPLHIRNLIDSKSGIDELYRHIETAYKGQHIEKIIQMKLGMTRFIRIFSMLMNEKVNHEQKRKGKRKTNQLIGRTNPRKDKTNKRKLSKETKRNTKKDKSRSKRKER